MSDGGGQYITGQGVGDDKIRKLDWKVYLETPLKTSRGKRNRRSPEASDPLVFLSFSWDKGRSMKIGKHVTTVYEVT